VHWMQKKFGQPLTRCTVQGRANPTHRPSSRDCAVNISLSASYACLQHLSHSGTLGVSTSSRWIKFRFWRSIAVVASGRVAGMPRPLPDRKTWSVERLGTGVHATLFNAVQPAVGILPFCTCITVRCASHHVS
jgi:hypothetical protein